MPSELVYSLPPPAEPRRLVACLCAAWCGTCRDYQNVLKQQAGLQATDAFVWLDVEDEAELVDDLDIETFPTILVLDAERVLFCGPVLPGGEALARLLRAVDDNGAQPTHLDDEVLALAERLRQRAGLTQAGSLSDLNKGSRDG